MVLRYWEEYNAGEDHNDFENTAQVAEEVNCAIDCSVMRLLQGFQINICHKNSMLSISAIFPISGKRKQTIAIVKSGTVAWRAVADGKPTYFRLCNNLS